MTLKNGGEIDLDLKKIDNLEFDGVNHGDYPDYSDAFVSEGDYVDRKLSDKEIDWVNDEHRDWAYEKLMDSLY
jgi:hypothetical protein